MLDSGDSCLPFLATLHVEVWEFSDMRTSKARVPEVALRTNHNCFPGAMYHASMLGASPFSAASTIKI